MQPIKNGQNGPNRVRILLRHNGHLISVHLWHRLSTFIPKHFLQNLKNLLVANRTIYGRTLGHPVNSWVAFGDRATLFQQHCPSYCSSEYDLYNFLIFIIIVHNNIITQKHVLPRLDCIKHKWLRCQTYHFVSFFSLSCKGWSTITI